MDMKPKPLTEIVAGASSFMAAAYIVVVNPAILSQAGMPYSAVLTATVLVCFFSSLMMGLYARNPIIVAPGMGLNAFFTFSVVKGMQVPWPVALGAVFWAGVIFLLLSIFNIRTHIVRAIPSQLRYAITVGIGLFIALIGFVNAGFVVHHPATVVGVAALTPPIAVFAIGLFVTSVLVVLRIRGALLIGMLLTTVAAATLGRFWGGGDPIVTWNGAFAAPDFSLVFALDLAHSITWALIPVIFAFVFTGMFDGLSTFVALAEAADLMNDSGEPRNIKRSLETDATSTIVAAFLGSSPGTAYIESAVGIEAGGKTGLTAVTGALLFLPFLFLSPLLSAVPLVATAPALVVVGVYMVRPVVRIRWTAMDEAIPAFLAIVLIPFSYSITQGIIWGFLSWTLLKVVAGRAREVSIALWIIDAFAIVALWLE
jgi:AGZA family xanthine/uracil permease-like MFS transporter